MDNSRKLSGFNELSQGVNNGIAPSLLKPDQAFQAVNVSFRGDFPATRSSWFNHPFLGAPATWTGIFQGAMHYDGEAGQSGWLVARGGRFFFITDDTFTITDVTPQLIIVTTQDFTTPGVGNQVLVSFNGNAPVMAGDTVTIGGIQYGVIAPLSNQLQLQQINGAGGVMVVAGTPLFDAGGTNQLIAFYTYSPAINFVFMFQAENYGIVLGGQEATLIWDGKTLRKSALNEVPSGFLGAYGWGRIWITRPDRRTFVAGDIVFGPSGTPQNGFRDAILKFTENDFLNEGGSFGVPYNAGPITTMQFLATQDTSLGTGVLLVGTTNMVFSVNAPVDRTTWKNLQYPIQTIALIDYGPLSPRGSIPINGDMWYRSEDGIRSFIVARRLFGNWGNTPMSREVGPTINLDTPELIFWGSSMLFDNKMFMTVSPEADFNQQVTHQGLVIMNFDLVSDLSGKQAPAWEGFYTGLNILLLTKCRINGNERGFIFAQGSDIELWEINPDGMGLADQFTNNSNILTNTPIACQIQTRAEDYGYPLELKRLIMAEIYLEDIADTVVFTISYKPDQYCSWIPWKSFTVCSTVSQCQITNLPGQCVFQVNAKSYAARLTIPQPADDCNGMTGKPAREFHDAQFQLLWTGHCTVKRFFTHTKLQTQPTEGICPPTVTCLAFPCCPDNLFTYDSHGLQLGNAILQEEGGNILQEGGGRILQEV
jgi:hypothetical protein